MANTSATHAANFAWILPVEGTDQGHPTWVCGRPAPLPGHAEAIRRVLLLEQEQEQARGRRGQPTGWMREAIAEGLDTGCSW